MGEVIFGYAATFPELAERSVSLRLRQEIQACCGGAAVN